MDAKIAEGNLVEVYWLDTIEVNSWTNIQLIKDAPAALAKSVGWFFNEDNDVVRLLTSIIGTQDSDMDAGYTVIPKAAVKRIEVVREDEFDVE